MQKTNKPTEKMLLQTEAEIFERMVPVDDPFRKLDELIDFNYLVEPLRDLYSDLGRTGFAIDQGFKALLVQFWEDYSDRQMEKLLKENVTIRWFCGFGLLEPTPDYSYFCRLRQRIGVKRLEEIFNMINAALKEAGLFGDFFTFVDASALVTKMALWSERDKAISQGADRLDNSNVSHYAADKDARWGAKSATNFWFGYKRHHAVNMRHGLISKVAVTPANVPDNQAFSKVCPDRGMVFSDKIYDCQAVDLCIREHDCQAATIRKNNNPRKNHDLDRWRSAVRMPFEGTFSKLRKRARYRGKYRVWFQCVAEALCHNLKKAVNLLPAGAVVI